MFLNSPEDFSTFSNLPFPHDFLLRHHLLLSWESSGDFWKNVGVSLHCFRLAHSKPLRNLLIEYLFYEVVREGTDLEYFWVSCMDPHKGVVPIYSKPIFSYVCIDKGLGYPQDGCGDYNHMVKPLPNCSIIKGCILGIPATLLGFKP